MTLRLRRARWAAEVSGHANAARASLLEMAAGFDAGTNASKNSVAGRSQKSIAALSIRDIPPQFGSERTERGCLQLPPRAIRAHTGSSEIHKEHFSVPS
jgi:hypothetical protein